MNKTKDIGTLNKLKNRLFKRNIGKSSCTIYSERDSSKNTYAIKAECPTGKGIDSDPFLLSKLAHLIWFSENERYWNGVFKQIRDIDASRTLLLEGGLSPIGSSSIPFTGTYDGNGHIISRLSISDLETDYQGLFGITMNACICNLGLLDINIEGLNNVGGIVGYMNGGYIRNCFATGEVLGSYYVGGICGKADFPDISDCYAKVSVLGGYFCGGICGKSHAGMITRSYSAGHISGAVESEYTGGLIGHNVEGSTVIDGDFYNRDIFTGQTHSGVGKKTIEMKSVETYLAAKWTFYHKGTAECSNLWVIEKNVNDGYPVFLWQKEVSS